jgi:LacI family transcriptional regulator
MTDPAAAPARATLQDVATRAGVGLKTASRAVNGEPHVSEATRDRVLEAAAELGFQLNAGASLLARGQTSSFVGLVTGDLTNPFYAALAQGVERELRLVDTGLTLASSDESPGREVALVDELVRRQVRAVIVVSTLESHAAYAALQRRGIPVVLVDRAPVDLDADAVVLENREGGAAAAEHLLAHGHRRIGFLGDVDRLPTFRERLAGFGERMRAAGVDDWERHVRAGAHDPEAAAALTRDLLDGPDAPTALFASNNRATVGALRELSTRADAPPALVGFDDMDLGAVLGLTVVAHDPVEMGRRAALAAIDRLADRRRPTSLVRLPTRVVARGSGERPPA